MTVAALYLRKNMAWIHGICVPQTRGANELLGGSNTYVMHFPRVLQSVKCPVTGCLAVAHSAVWLRAHLMYRHFWSQVAVV